MLNEQFKCEAKFKIGQYKSLKQIFCKFVGQSGQGQGHQF